jgi:hypothetical protein
MVRNGTAVVIAEMVSAPEVVCAKAVLGIVADTKSSKYITPEAVNRARWEVLFGSISGGNIRRFPAKVTNIGRMPTRVARE